MNHSAMLTQRPASTTDPCAVVGFVLPSEEPFFCSPEAAWPLTGGPLAAASAERRNSTGALLQGRLAGFANFCQWQRRDFYAPGKLMIAPWARGQGVAHYLIEVMERQAREQFKVGRMTVSCFNANASGLLLYAKLGYRPQAIIERRDPQGHRVALVQLEKALV